MDRGQHLKMKDFDIIKELGCGSYGRVQLIKRKEDKKFYALKSMFLANAKQKEKDAALNQIRLLASINMPYVISYKSSFYVQQLQSLCIVMEYADGGDLEGKINNRAETCNGKGFQQRFIWKTAYQILKGLKGLHQHNIIHRDMKCANIFFVGDVAKIGDLNISKITDNGFASTQTGTPYYTSPQIWKGQKYDNKCDIWALGCIIYQMCTLLPPFRAQDFPGLFQAVTTGKYQEIPKKYTKNLVEFIALCLRVDPNQRPSAINMLEKSYFAQFQLGIEEFKEELTYKSDINIIQPIECPKVLRFLNDKLPKSKFQQNSKKTVCLIGHETSTSFKIKTKKFRSQKVIMLDEQDKEEKKIPKFLINRSNVKLPKLQKQLVQVKSIKSTTKIPLCRDEPRSMKNIEKQNKKQLK